jgi:ATP-dependent Clp protease ATP-binding subunit ClpX
MELRRNFLGGLRSVTKNTKKMGKKYMKKNNKTNKNNKECEFCYNHTEDILKMCPDCFETLMFGQEPQENDFGIIPIKNNKKSKIEIPTPQVIKDYLDKYIINQDEAKKKLAVCVYNHYKKVEVEEKTKQRMNKTNILLVGPTGSGKTYMIQKIKELLNVPMIIADASLLTKSGYKGKSVDDLIFQLFISTKGNIADTERGIIYIDEFDKISASRESDLDVGGRSVQQELLKMIEGADVEITIDELSGEKAFINTSKMLFIFSGAFSGLIDKKENSGIKNGGLRKIGFNNESSKTEGKDQQKLIQTNLGHKDLIEYGMIPELMGRIPIIAQLNKLEVVDLVRIMTESKNSIVKQYKTLFTYENIDLVFKKDALLKIAEIALSKNIGARGLNSIIEERMVQLTFDILESKNSKRKKMELVLDEKNNKLKRNRYIINSSMFR